MAHYIDTSAFLKLVMTEEHSDALRRWVRDEATDAFACDLLRTEALRAARRHSPEALSEARARLDALTLLTLSTSICARAAELDPQIPRSLDVLHLAAALTVGDDLAGLVTYDDRLAAAAALHGVAVISPR